MELLLCLVLLILLRLIAVPAVPPGKAGRCALDPSDMPLRVHQAIRRKAQGIAIRTVHVEMDGADTVRYTVSGSMPDGSDITLVVRGDEQVIGPESKSPEEELPAVVQERLSQCMPSFHPGPGRVRLVRGSSSQWYEVDGELAGGLPVGVKISPDGHDLLMTIID